MLVYCMVQHVAPYQAGNPGRANNILARKFGTNGHHQPQEGQHVSTTSNKIDKVTTDQTDIVEIALKNVKLNTSLKSELPSVFVICISISNVI